MEVESRVSTDMASGKEDLPTVGEESENGTESGLLPASATARTPEQRVEDVGAVQEATGEEMAGTETIGEEASGPGQPDNYTDTQASSAAEDGATVAKTTDDREDDSVHVPNACAVKENDVKDECLAAKGEHAEGEHAEGEHAEGEHAEKEGEDRTIMDILGNGTLIKKILTPGAGRNSRPESNDIVTLRVEGQLEDGTVVDKYDALSFILNDGEVIHAFDLAVALMELGEECELRTGAKYAYGELGREPDVPSNATITYRLMLMEKKPGPVYIELSPLEKFILGEKKRERGNYLFARKDWTGAINSYNKALRILESPSAKPPEEELLKKMKDCRVKCYNNLAACQLKGGMYDAVIRNCNEVLKIETENVKALFRAGKAYANKGDTKQSIIFLKRAVQHDPSNKSAQHELYLQTKKQLREATNEKEMYQRMLGTKKLSPKRQTNTWKKPLMLGAAAAVLLSIGAAAYRYSAH